MVIRWVLLSILTLHLIAPAVGNAQVPVVTNITSTPGAGDLGTIVTPNGNLHDITGGTRPGGGPNLFHSFGNFSVGGGDLANFLNNTGLATSNILGRVTGGNISSIDGTIQTTGFGNANLFLMNPSGIVLGPGASLNVGGSVSFTTAQYLRLFDGVSNANFYANPANDALANSILTINASAFEFLSASPAAYGFLTAPDPNATLTVQGSLLSISEGRSLSLVGGNITIQSGILGDGTTQAANLQAPGGQVNLVSVASPGEMQLSDFQPAPNINGTSFSTMGTVMLKEGSTLDVSGQLDEFGTPIGNGNSGTVLVRGGRLVMDTSSILANTVGAVDGASRAVDMDLSHDISLSNFASIVTGTSGSGQGGDVVINGGTLELSNISEIRTETTGPGSGGNLFLNVGTLRLGGGFISSSTIGSDLDFDGVVDVIAGSGGNIMVHGVQGMGSAADSVALSGGSGITSTAREFSQAGGQISITTTSLELDEASSIRSSTNAATMDLNSDGVVDVTGRGGAIAVAIQRLSLRGGAAIASSADNFFDGAADGGTVTVRGLTGPESMADSVLLSGESTRIVSESVLGLPGDLTLNAETLTITNGAVVSAGSPLSTGPAGAVTVTAGSVVISADGQIFSQSFAQDSGQVTITADKLTMDKGSIVTSTLSGQSGRGGDVVLNVDIVSLTNGASIKSQSETFSNGRAGDITMNIGSLTLANHAEITSSSKGIAADAGDAGNVTITATGALASSASIIATSAVNAKGGDIDVTGGSVVLSNGTAVSASSSSPLLPDGEGNAGNIHIESGSTVLIEQSSVTTEASQASGGQITINAPDMIRFIDSPISTSVAGAAGDSNGGNISIDPDFVVLKGSQILAQAFAGSGGAIDVTAGLFLADPASVVDASSTLGVSGTVQINAPINNLSSVVARLSDSLLAVQALLRASCAAKLAQGSASSFVERGRDGIPAGPDSLLASPYAPPTSGFTAQRPASPVFSGIQLRRLFRPEMPSPVTLISDQGGCVS